MSMIKPLSMLAVAMTVALYSGNCLAQNCVGCAQTGAAGSFGYPVTANGCGSCGSSQCSGCQLGHRGGTHELKAKLEHTQALHAKVTARNDAWPMPFNCADRQLYMSIWESQIDQGFEEQCVLNSAHFDAETNELNRFGQHTVAGIMQNMPTTRKKVFIHQEVTPQLNEARMLAVKETINTFYSQSGPAQVAFSSKLPVTMRGPKAEGISRLWLQSQPTPAIQISAGETVSSAVSN